MTWETQIMQALSPLPCPVSKWPGSGGETYCVYNLVRGGYGADASNVPTRARHTVQVHLFSTRDDGTHITLFEQALGLLRRAGLRPYGWGPDLYENDTGYHHMACTCEITEKSEEA